MCGIWDWQSTIVKDLNDSQDPKHTLICRENAFVAIYALFSDNKCPLFTRLGGGGTHSSLKCETAWESVRVGQNCMQNLWWPCGVSKFSH